MPRLLITLSLFIACNAQAQIDSSIYKYKTDSGYFHSFDNTSIYYESRGTGYPVVLVHGFLNTADNWKRTILLPQLLKNGYRVILLDLRGNGRSDKLHSEAGYANDAEAKDIIALTHFLKINQYDIVGYSRGSIITTRVVLLDKKVNKAVIGGMGTGFTNPQWPRRIQFYEAFIGNATPALQPMMANVRKMGMDTLELAYMQKQQPSASPDELGKIRKKVLVICGDHDDDNGSVQDLAKMIHSSILVTVPGDHGGAVRTKEFSEAVLSFLK
jgi:Predicted hydrolases or acyltransferases (alpha/beta hydrolase superfamily)